MNYKLSTLHSIDKWSKVKIVLSLIKFSQNMTHSLIIVCARLAQNDCVFFFILLFAYVFAKQLKMINFASLYSKSLHVKLSTKFLTNYNHFKSNDIFHIENYKLFKVQFYRFICLILPSSSMHLKLSVIAFKWNLCEPSLLIPVLKLNFKIVIPLVYS